MTINRFAARADSNRAEIVKVFKDHGWSVYDVRRPVDLMLGKGGITILVEIKTGKGKHTSAQTEFIKGWKGGAVITIRDVEGAETVARMVG
jgi:hypothetical protein